MSTRTDTAPARVPTVLVTSRQGARPELRTYDVSIRRGTETITVCHGVSLTVAERNAAELRGALADAYCAGRREAECAIFTARSYYERGIEPFEPEHPDPRDPDDIRDRDLNR